MQVAITAVIKLGTSGQLKLLPYEQNEQTPNPGKQLVGGSKQKALIVSIYLRLR